MLPSKLRGFKPSGPSDDTKRFLQCFYRVLDSDGQKNLAADIEKCADDDAIRRLAKRIRNEFIIPIKAQGSKISMELAPSPRNRLAENWILNVECLDNENMDPSPQHQLRSHCLERDGHRCLASGMWDRHHPHPKNGMTAGSLNGAHIIPFALGSFQADKDSGIARQSILWLQLERYFPALREISFTSADINTERNILILSGGAHHEFGEFNIAFEATNTPQVYRIKTFPNISGEVKSIIPKNRLVTFKVHDGQSWDLPDPELLKIHAAIGNFLHMSGQAEQIDKIIYQFEECGGLAPSGSTDVEGLLAASSLSLLDYDRRADVPAPLV